MNRRTFVHTLGAGAVGLAAVRATSTPAAAVRRTAAADPFANGPIRIGSNENPYGPSPSAVAAVAEVASIGNRYGRNIREPLVEMIAANLDVPTEYVMLSGGSGDILRAVSTVFTSPAKAIVGGTPSYESPMRTAESLGHPVKRIPVKADMTLDLDAMAEAAVGAGLFYICNPNNPTATALPAETIAAAIERVLTASPETYVLVDEAYFEYADLPGFGTAAPLVKTYPQVIVARTFSKIHGMAGMRVGYAIAQPETLDKMGAIHSSSGMSVMSLAAATASLRDTAHLEEQVMLNREVRQMTIDAFTSAGYTVADSHANFIFVKTDMDAAAFQAACRQQGVLAGRPFPPALDWARISIGTREEMQAAIPVFMRVLSMSFEQVARIDSTGLELLPTELT
jgi:histidinol-phosphate aminotransferase